jgi:hypothetical protein
MDVGISDTALEVITLEFQLVDASSKLSQLSR